mmetsp:Transcript_14432/g.29518  ORF Transcript_14432/g.29518 Transcript_14432/m.29518 type:complete len:175 (-) Transcript_14432:1061-1585(-)|eukprot:CAMPEP_0184683250 /NCGR_PEP_ID=MMETSP0312-20130426/10498_1 /TAXON_ID=31354 /ORGANISM="Compsopogon coeruleus, Strain SAG 36.94" /LENGTH=174 /DNA_ID=CAMNT_0027135425 /DNA_START=157 /DNA_END=681 /DNA_ORIENTATION=-
MEQIPRKEQKFFTTQTKATNLSPYSEKLVLESLVMLFSVIEFGRTSESVSRAGGAGCEGLCAWSILSGVVSFVFAGVVLLLNYLCANAQLSRYGFFSHKFEMYMMMALTLWWVPGVATASAINNAHKSGVGTFFAWASFFGSILATYKAYHSYKEEDEPDSVPYGYDEGAYIYG